jgi:hypothetical protein
MKVKTEDGKTFTLTRECEADHQFIDAVASDKHIHRASMVPGPKNENGAWQYQSAVIVVSYDSDEALWAKAGGQALGSMRNLFRLGLSQPTNEFVARFPGDQLGGGQVHVQPQEEFAATLEKLQTMLEALRLVVVKQEAVLNVLVCAHSEALVVEKSIVAQGGAA